MAKNSSPLTPHTSNFYRALLGEVKERIRSAQYEALKAVNKEMVGLYWDIGRLIVERQDVEGWGKAVVEQLAADLRTEFPGVGGFSASNLWRMKAFFEAYTGLEKLAPLVREIGWSHNLAILERCKDPLEREFYLRMTRKFGWSKNVLIHQIDNQSYEKSLLGQTNFDRALTPELRAQAMGSTPFPPLRCLDSTKGVTGIRPGFMAPLHFWGFRPGKPGDFCLATLPTSILQQTA